ncbi:MAG: hypothetical protein GX603_01640 [Chloroflexi bacterium]|mgnify:CR=1 FL=1|nr:hypothetical protein [Chloroflexota bacterium]
MNEPPENPDLQTEDYSRHPWKRYLGILKWYGLAILVITLVLSGLGYSGAGWEGVKNGLTWGLLIGIVGLPLVGLLISVNVWSGYANRWGEVKYKEMLEGKPEDKKTEE